MAVEEERRRRVTRSGAGEEKNEEERENFVFYIGPTTCHALDGAA